MLEAAFETIVREERAKIRATLIRLTGNWELAEDCVQEASFRAWNLWSVEGLPSRPAAWLTTVARRIALDQLRRDRRLCELPDDLTLPERYGDGDLPPESISGVEDDLLRLIFTCCHPVLSSAAQIALTLRSVCGLTTREIARAFLEPEATTAQRIVRARRKLADDHIAFEVPERKELAVRVDSVLLVIYLVFSEGYGTTAGPALLRSDLCREAIRLARLAVRLLPCEPEARGLLAMMLLHDSRRETRVGAQGEMVPLEEQDRSLWDRNRISEGLEQARKAFEQKQPGPCQIQAAIAALHAEASDPKDTDWKQIAALYFQLLKLRPSAVVQLNAAVAVAMTGRLTEALNWIEAIERSGELRDYHLLHGAKADLLRRAGNLGEAVDAYKSAISLAPSEPERKYLRSRLATIQSTADGNPTHPT